MEYRKIDNIDNCHMDSVHISDEPYGRVGTYPVYQVNYITYCNSMTLAHEVAHAILMLIEGGGSEVRAWEIAKSFFRPDLWDEEFFKNAIGTYDGYPEKNQRIITHKVLDIPKIDGIYIH